MWTSMFWKATVERAVKSFCQALLLALGADATGVFTTRWDTALGAAAGMAVLSLLTSVTSGLVPTDGGMRTPSLVRTTTRPPWRRRQTPPV
jgi:hypothetical protein